VTGDELRGTTVADLIREPLLFQEEWHGAAGVVRPRSLPRPAHRRSVDGAWSSLAGHRDWSRVWAERWTHREGRSGFLIVPEGTDVMGLFVEALAQLPEDEAENVTFITRLNGDRDGVHFDWIGVTADSELAVSVQQRYPDRTLDLTRPLGSVPRPEMTEQEVTPAGAGSHRTTDMREPSDSDRDDDVDDGWKDEPKHRPKNGSARRRPPPPAAPPPPPPPQRVFGRNKLAIGIGAGFTSAVLLGGFIWLVMADHSSSRNPDPSQANGSLPTGGSDRIAGPGGSQGDPPTVIEPTSPPERTGQSGGASESRDGTDTESGSRDQHPLAVQDKSAVKGGRVVHLKDGWLWDLLKDGKDALVELADKDVLPKSSTLQLRFSKDLGLAFKQKSDGKPDQGIEIRLNDETARKTGERDSSISIRVTDKKLEFRRSGRFDAPTGEGLLDRLAFSVLDIIPVQEHQLASAAPVRVVFTPRLHAIPFSDPADAPAEWEGAVAYLAAAKRFQDAVEPRLRVDRVALSIVPGERSWWPFDATKSAVPLAGTLTGTVRINGPKGGPWPVDLNVSAKADGGKRPIVVQLDPPPAPAGASNGDDTPKAEARARKNAARETKAKTQKRGLRPAGQPDREKADAWGDDPNSPEGLSRTADPILLAELLRRYGLVHVSVVIRVSDGPGDKGVEVLRFGTAAPNSQP
jgi:hypothetical protein